MFVTRFASTLEALQSLVVLSSSLFVSAISRVYVAPGLYPLGASDLFMLNRLL